MRRGEGGGGGNAGVLGPGSEPVTNNVSKDMVVGTRLECERVGHPSKGSSYFFRGPPRFLIPRDDTNEAEV